MGAFGGFPEPPSVLKQLQGYQIIKWALVFVLLYQGGSGQNIQLALIITVIAYVAHMLLDRYVPSIPMMF